MAKRHYTDKDFIVSSTFREDDSGYGCQKGYCRICGGDMQRFLEGGQWGSVRHYNSHSYGGIKKAIPKQPKEKELTPLEKILSS